MILTFLLTASLFSPVPVEKVADPFSRDLVFIIGSHAADMYSTAWALHRCDSCVEGNKFAPTLEARIALKSAATATAALATWKLRRDGHPNWAMGVRVATMVVNGVFVLNNAVHAIRGK